MEVRFHPDALAEMIAAAQYHDRRVPGLGARFLDAVEMTARQVQRQPALGAVDPAGRRRRAVRRFPHRLIYRFDSANLFVLAVAHGCRRPGYWMERGL